MADKLTHQDTAQATLKLLPKATREAADLDEKPNLTNVRAGGRIVAACRGGGQVRVFLALPDHADAVKAGLAAAIKAATAEDAAAEQ